jgi:hypothetical protein
VILTRNGHNLTRILTLRHVSSMYDSIENMVPQIPPVCSPAPVQPLLQRATSDCLVVGLCDGDRWGAYEHYQNRFERHSSYRHSRTHHFLRCEYLRFVVSGHSTEAFSFTPSTSYDGVFRPLDISFCSEVSSVDFRAGSPKASQFKPKSVTI